MNRPVPIRLVLALLVIVALVLPSLPSQALAGADPAASMAMDAGMTDDMLCCPSEAPAPFDCQKCPLMALCVVGYAPGVPVLDNALIVFPTVARTIPRADELEPVGLSPPPPAEPPRSSMLMA